MKEFVLKSFNFILFNIILITLIIFLFENSDTVESRNRNNFLNRYNITFQKIKSYKEKKIIFIGGSNLAFGLDTKRIQEKNWN